MANRKNGEVAFEPLGEGATIRLTLGQLCALRGELGAIYDSERAADSLGKLFGMQFHFWLCLKLVAIDPLFIAAVAKHIFKGTGFKWEDSDVSAGEIARVMADCINVCVAGKTFEETMREVNEAAEKAASENPQQSPAT